MNGFPNPVGELGEEWLRYLSEVDLVEERLSQLYQAEPKTIFLRHFILCNESTMTKG
jgi:hypothetical protein